MQQSGCFKTVEQSFPRTGSSRTCYCAFAGITAIDKKFIDREFITPRQPCPKNVINEFKRDLIRTYFELN